MSDAEFLVDRLLERFLQDLSDQITDGQTTALDVSEELQYRHLGDAWEDYYYA